jgi:glutathione S-transferase
VLLYNFGPSGNCYKVRLLLAQLGISYERKEVRLRMTPEEKAAFKARVSPLGRVPALVLDDGRMLAESNAIVWYLAEGSRFVPADPVERARALQWMFWEQYDHEPAVAVVRAWVRYFGVPAGKEQELVERRGRAMQALAVMEEHLAGRAWFAGEAYSVADIALYAYTHVAEEGDLSLAGFPALRGWLDRVAAQPGHVTIDA